MFLHTMQFAAGHGPQLSGDFAIACGKRLDRASFDNNDQLASEIASADNACSLPISKPKMSPGKIERADLPTAVIKGLGGANRTADELVKIFGRLVFSVDLEHCGQMTSKCPSFRRNLARS